MPGTSDKVVAYRPLPTMRRFHESSAQMRCIVGPVGSGKTTAAAWEVCYYLPFFLAKRYKIKKTRWCIVRATIPELLDSTQRTVFGWFTWGKYKVQKKEYILKYPDDIEVELIFRSCENFADVEKFKGLELTGYWIDESVEVIEDLKRMLKTRLGRMPPKCPARWGIETTNPPDVEHPIYSQFKWDSPPPGPISEKKPLENHVGFWQPPRENEANLRLGYYDDLRLDYADNPDWVDTYIDGKPGIFIQGEQVYKNFRTEVHVAHAPLSYAGGPLYRGWDNSGNWPACVVVQIPTAQQFQVLAEFHGDKMGIVDFTRHVVQSCNVKFPNATYEDWADPAGNNKFSKKTGGFTSNAILMEGSGVYVQPSDQNPVARKESVESQLKIIDGLLIDPSCIRLINGFISGYCYPMIGNSGSYANKPAKNRWSHVHESLQYVMLKLVKSQDAPIPPAVMARILRSRERRPGGFMAR